MTVLVLDPSNLSQRLRLRLFRPEKEFIGANQRPKAPPTRWDGVVDDVRAGEASIEYSVITKTGLLATVSSPEPRASNTV